jgi:UDP:flavonoid glycosyltransferase YjiC (YdhE family)
MTHVVLSTYGSFGDLFPFIALGQALSRRGHRVTFAVSAAHVPLVERAGFPVRTVHENRDALLPYQAQIYGGQRPPGQTAIAPRLLFEQEHIPTLPQKVANLREACADADCLVSIGHQHAAPIVAELTGIAWATVVLTPLFLPSSYFSPVPIPTLPPFRRFSNRISWKIGERLMRAVADWATNMVRAIYGLPPRTNVLLNGNHSHLLTALAASPAFLAPPPDWPAHVVTPGFCFYDQAKQWAPPGDVHGRASPPPQATGLLRAFWDIQQGGCKHDNLYPRSLRGYR